MIRFLIIIAAIVLICWLISKIFSKNKANPQDGQNLPLLLMVAAAVIGLAFMVLPRLGINPLVLFQKLMQLIPYVRGFLPF